MKLSAWIALAILLPLPAASAASPVRYGPPKLLAVLKNRSIVESSGMAPSRRDTNLLWTHNDSGDRARLFAFDQAGKHVAQVRLPVKAADWEDMASFTLDGKPYLLVADMGDNMRRRKRLSLHLIEEPDLSKLEQGATLRLKPEDVMTVAFVLEGGPQDCEGIAVDTTDKKIYFITKTVIRASQVHVMDLPDRKPAELLTAKRLVRVPIRLATAMDISPDGRRCIILTYVMAYEYQRDADETWEAAFGRPPSSIRVPPLPKGEAVCYGQDGTTLFITSERLPTPLWKLPVLPEAAAP
jgi:sugar lactone lactonase YvrE